MSNSMSFFICRNCGSNDYYEDGSFRVCKYCGTKYSIVKSDINLQEDVALLLKKCRENPEKARKIAQNILEIDPYNEEAKRILGINEQHSGGCYVATAVYGSYDCPQVWTLRRFRDNTLAETWYGRAFIRTYYAISPTLVKWFEDKIWFKNLWKPKLDRMVKKLNRKGVEDTPYQDRNW